MRQGGDDEGTAGVPAALACVAGYRRAGQVPAQNLMVLVTRAEEAGSWFPVSFPGSRAALGTLPAEALDVRRADRAGRLASTSVIAAWSYGLIRDTGAILLDMVPDPRLEGAVRRTVEAEGDRLTDLHLWRLGPGHLGAIVSVATTQASQGPEHHRRRLSRFPGLSHVTVEVQQA